MISFNQRIFFENVGKATPLGLFISIYVHMEWKMPKPDSLPQNSECQKGDTCTQVTRGHRTPMANPYL